MADVGGADYEVEIVVLGENGVLSHAFRLETELNTEKNLNLAGIFFLQLDQLIEIGIGVQKENGAGPVRTVRIIKIVMFRETHGLKAKLDTAEDHGLHGRGAVAGMMRVHMAIRSKNAHVMSFLKSFFSFA